MLGLFERTPRFVKRYDDLAGADRRSGAQLCRGSPLARLPDRRPDLPAEERLTSLCLCAHQPLDDAPPASVHLGWGRKRPAIGSPIERTEARFGATPGHQRNLPSRGRRESAPRPAARLRQELWRLADRRRRPVPCARAAASSSGSSTRSAAVGRPGRAARPDVFKDIGAGKTAQSPQQLDELSDSGSKAVRASALFTRAALALQQNDTEARDRRPITRSPATTSLPQPYRDAALIRQTALEFDQLKPQQVIARLQPLAKPGNPWFGSAGEMTAHGADQAGQEARGRAAVRRHRQGQDSSRLHPCARSSRSPARSASTPARALAAPGPIGPRMTKATSIPRRRDDRRGARRERLQHVQEGQGPKTPVLGQRIAGPDQRERRRGRSRDCGAADEPSRAGRQHRLDAVRRQRLQVDGPARARHRAQPAPSPSRPGAAAA